MTLKEEIELLMCRPDYYGISDPKDGHFSNALHAQAFAQYSRNPEEWREDAQAQHQGLSDLFNYCGAKVTLVKPFPEALDQVFMADSFFSMRVMDRDTKKLQTRVLVSNFSNATRAIEKDLILAELEKLKEADPTMIIKECPYRIEGTGDNVYDRFRDVIWSGFTLHGDPNDSSHGRSTLEAHEFLSDFMDTEVIAHETASPFFHRDTSLLPLPRGEMLLFPGGYKDFDQDDFNKRAFENFGLDPKEKLITVSQEDAEAYACNGRVINNNVIMPEGVSTKLQDDLQERGYKVHITNLDAFLISMGGPHCLANDISKTKVPGGYLHPDNAHLMPEAA